MNRALVPALAVLALATAGAAPEPETLTYTVTSVKRTLVRVADDGGKTRLAAGATARSGEVLRTGWWSAAELEQGDRQALFRLASRTRVRLAHDEPGVLLEVERGRTRAVFAPLGKDAPARLVTTPSAVLAVRGTEYGVEVAGDGTTTVAVFDGVVEVADRAGLAPPVEVTAGQSTRVRSGRAPEAPRAHGLDRADWDAGRGPDTGGRSGAGFGPGEPGSTGSGGFGGTADQPGSGRGRQPSGGGKGRGGG